MSTSTPPDTPPSKRQRAKSFVKSIRRKSSQLFRKQPDGTPSSPGKNRSRSSSSTISLLVADSTRSVLAISPGLDGKFTHGRASSDDTATTASSGESSKYSEFKIIVDDGEEMVRSPEPVIEIEPEIVEESNSEEINPREINSGEFPFPCSDKPSVTPEFPFRLLPPFQSMSEQDHDESTPTALSSPPSIMEEPEVPDPFLVDDPEDPMSDDSSSDAKSPPAPEEISLAPPAASPEPSPIAERLNAELPPVPPTQSTPEPDSEEDDEETPDLYIPALTAPTMFLPIPNTDPLTTLLNKYILSPDKRPVRDLTGEWQRSDFHTLVMSNSWRALARMARDRLVASNPEEMTVILPMWYLRLSCLARLRLFNQTSAECANLFSVLNSIEPEASRTWLFERLVPFELEVLQTRLKYWAGDHMAYIDALYALMKKCKIRSRQAKSDTTIAGMWQERGSRISLILASQFIEMKEFAAATSILEPLCYQPNGSTSPELRSAVGRIYLQSGVLDQALHEFGLVAADSTASVKTVEMNAALVASAEGDWTRATQILRGLVNNDPDNLSAVNNLSVALLSQGQLKEGIRALETALAAHPLSIVTAEPFLFNLSTLYELRSAVGMEQKRNLLIQVATDSGDGLRTTCLKMPTN